MKRLITALVLLAIASGTINAQGVEARVWQKMDRNTQTNMCLFFVDGYVTKIIMYSNQKLNGASLSSYSSTAVWDDALVKLFEGELVDFSTWIGEMADRVTEHFRKNPDAPFRIAMWESMHMVVIKYAGHKKP